MNPEVRQCAICPRSYPAGTYRAHRLSHTPEMYAAPHGWSKKRGMRNPERAAEMRRLAVDEQMTFKQIGARYGISRERVRQLLVATGLTKQEVHNLVLSRTDHPTHRLCSGCGEQYKVGHGLEHRMVRSHRWAKIGSKSDPAVRGAIAADYAAGMKSAAIQSKYGITPTTLSYAIRQFHIPMRAPHMGRKSRTNEEARARKAAILSDLAVGMTKEAIASRYGVSRSWVRIVEKQAAAA